MRDEHPVEFNVLDVGSGNKPRGDVNVDLSHGSSSQKKRANNFVIADAEFLPFRDEAFDVAFSAFTIEQVKEPFLMLKEMCRVAKRKTIVRYSYKLGSGARAHNLPSFLMKNGSRTQLQHLVLKASSLPIVSIIQLVQRS